jgi:tetratricopeptide (TPR) repeat protein
MTEAGRIAGQFAAVNRSLIAADGDATPAGSAGPDTLWSPGVGTPQPRAPAPAKPSKARAREAYRNAMQGVRLAREGRHAEAIQLLRTSVELDPTVAIVQHDLGFALQQAGRLVEAASAFQAAVQLDPRLAMAQHHLAEALDRLGNLEAAIQVYEATVALKPGDHAAQYRLGQLQFLCGRWEQAAVAFRAAAAAAPAGSPEARLSEAFALEASGDHGGACATLRAAIAAYPDDASAHLLLGLLLAQDGESATAAACLERGTALRPDMMSAWQGFATHTKFAPADRPLIERLGAILQRPDLTAANRRAVHFTLGKAYNDIGAYEEAMRHFDAANRIRAAGARLNRAALARQGGWVIAHTPADLIAQRARLGVADATPILIVGMPRSGTTLVEQILSSHPDVAAGGELPFWGVRGSQCLALLDGDEKPEQTQVLARDYLAVLRAISPTVARVTDKAPFNFLLLGAIHQVLPQATIVHCRRNPIDTCLSIFCTDFSATIDFAGDRGSLVFFYQQYQRLMAHWRQVLPPQRFIEVDYEQLVADPEPLTRRLVATCGLEWNDACLNPQANQRRIATASVWQARQPIYRSSVERWRRYEPWLGELRQLLPPDRDAAAAP